MFDTFKRSWDITKLTFRVIKDDKELVLFPILSSVFSLIFILLMILPSIMAMIAEDVSGFAGFGYLAVFAIYFGVTFIAVFFNVCVVYTAAERFAGRNSTVKTAVSFAFSRLGIIVKWSLLSATVGILLQLLHNVAEKMGVVGKIILKIVISLLGMAWSIITLFVVPSMVYQNLGPKMAIKDSVEVLKKTWGESLVRHFGLGAAQGIIFFLIIFGSLPILFFTFETVAFAFILGIVILLLVFNALIFGVANSVWNTALYVYGKSGKVPMNYDESMLSEAFVTKN